MASNHPSTVSPTYRIRSAIPADLPRLNEIERSAGQLFRTVGLDSVADDEPMPIEVLSSYLKAGNLWVAETEPQRQSDPPEAKPATNGDNNTSDTKTPATKEVVAFLAVFPIIRNSIPPPPTHTQSSSMQTQSTTKFLHIAELSVHSSHQRRGLAKRLIQHLITHPNTTSLNADGLEDQQVVGISLTTYCHLPFNAPFYAKLGFDTVAPEDIEDVVGVRGRELWEEEQEKIAQREKRCWMVMWLNK